MSEDFIIAIPARYESTRIPGKALSPLAGKTLLEHVCDRARTSSASQVIVATDDERIVETCERAGIAAVMTSAAHGSGTDRLAELSRKKEWNDDQIVVNLQGDEPLIPPQLLNVVAANLAEHPKAGVATLCAPIHEAAELFNPNSPKVVMDARGYALYFSRAPIPWNRTGFAASMETLPTEPVYYRHIGLYAYRTRVLQQLATTAPSPAESAESLEQLRALHLRIPIHVGVVDDPPPAGVDTAEDLVRVERLLKEGGP